jgi:copper chaperone CopZ
MKHTYKIEGMTCSGCEEKVRTALLQIENITAVEVSKDTHSATIDMINPISLEDLQIPLAPKYKIKANPDSQSKEEIKSWFETYKPILLIFFYISIVTTIMAFQNMTTNQMNINEIGMKWMNHFMGGFFLAFSFFKLLNLKGFAESYQTYDIIAKRFPIWAYFYAYLELALGLSFLANIHPLITNSVTFVVMSISIIGVLQAVRNKRKIQCACLGTIFNLPMSTITIIEDALMILMSGIMIVLLV